MRVIFGQFRCGWRRLAAAASAWVVLTFVGAWLHAHAWSGQAFPDGSAADVWVKPASNASQTLLLPGWAVVLAAFGREHTHTLFGAISASAIGAGLIVVGWLCGCALWRRARVPRRAGATDSGRRRFLVDMVAGGSGVVCGGAAVRATLIEPWSLETREYEVAIRGLPASLDGMRVVQVSDTHYGPRVSRRFLEGVVRRASALRGDLYVLTGDYVHDGTAHIAAATEILRSLLDVSGSMGVVGVLGNHDWYADGPAVRTRLSSMGVRMVDNNRVYVDASRRALTDAAPSSGLCVAGVGDLLEDVVDPQRALGGVPVEMPRLVLSHHPDCAEDPAFGVSLRADLMLSGHTHGGQVSLPLVGSPIVPSSYGQKYAGGVADGPRFPVVVSRGIGMSILPVRFGVPPELVVVTLRASDQS